MDAKPGTPEFDELDVLVDLVELFESKREPIGFPSPLGAIRFRMEQGNFKTTRSGSVPREQSQGLRSPLRPAGDYHANGACPSQALWHSGGRAAPRPRGRSRGPIQGSQWKRFPLKAMAKLGWISNRPNLADNAEATIRELIQRTGGPAVAAAAALYRKNDYARANAKADSHALKAWCWRVLADASENSPEVDYERGTVTPKFIRKVARLSWYEAGPFLAKELLQSTDRTCGCATSSEDLSRRRRPLPRRWATCDWPHPSL